MDNLSKLDEYLEELTPTKDIKDEVNMEEKRYTPKVDKSNEKDYDAWMSNIKPEAIDASKFRKFDRVFTIVTHETIPEERKTDIIKAIKIADDLGFTLRSSADNREPFIMDISNRYDRVEFYVPWKGFNKNIKGEEIIPSRGVFNKACYLHKAFNKIPSVVKKFVARNVQLMLGERVDTPVNFIIIYTPNGQESTKNIKYSEVGNAAFFLNVAEEFNIPVFNFGNKDAFGRFEEFISSFKG